ncbi:MAG: hypothetical protein HWD59_02340 [Coxiellaceae bacterium]|nr:MAG: hypothetical protein HWD59_02340 [Coxiellaceae bacterium]
MSVLTDANRDISEQNKTLQQTLLTENNNHASQLKQKRQNMLTKRDNIKKN